LAFSSPKQKQAFVLVPYSKHVNFQVFNGGSIAAKLPLLEGSGKGIRHIKFRYDEPIDAALVVKAVRLSLAA
jgi:hypothetical protein